MKVPFINAMTDVKGDDPLWPELQKLEALFKDAPASRDITAMYMRRETVPMLAAALVKRHQFKSKSASAKEIRDMDYGVPMIEHKLMIIGTFVTVDAKGDIVGFYDLREDKPKC